MEASRTVGALVDLGDDEALRARLAAALAGVPGARVAVALRLGARIATAASDDSGWTAPIGCVAKLLTAMLVRGAVTRRLFELATPVAEALGANNASLRGVTLRHLLEHTHGLDDSLLAPPRYSAALIDRAELLGRIDRLPRTWPPGALYSYGNLGAWLAAAVLERVHARAYGELVRDAALAPLAARFAVAAPTPICAATGSGIALTAEELVRLVTEQSPEHVPAWPDNDDFNAITPLPGWHPLERGVFLGWKHAARGWFGHQSTRPQASIFVRLEPRRGQALAVLSRERPAAVVALRMFGAYLPELFDLRLPCGEAAGTGCDALWCGRYEHAAHAIAIESHRGALRAHVTRRDAAGVRYAEATSMLHAAAAGVRLARPPTELLPYAQVVTSDATGTVLWNGRWALRKSAQR
jgi:CubicO group peptidase (beta-lactamase class C family)